jgi:hypothetical protein
VLMLEVTAFTVALLVLLGVLAALVEQIKR